MEKVEAKLTDVKGVAMMIECSPRHVYRMSDAGWMPRPMKIGRMSRWRIDHIDKWINDGCPKCSNYSTVL